MKEILVEIDPGVTFTGWERRDLLPPKPVLPAFQDVSSARVEAKTYVDEARALQERLRRSAEAEAHDCGRRAACRRWSTRSASCRVAGAGVAG
jgi:regulator of protease activity HflC (stomatin/prohibitin superfamily)